jgi:hypothetical protein
LIDLIRRFRSPLIAIVAVIFSASIVLAGQPAASGKGLANAAAHSGQTVPNQAGDESQEPDESETPDASESDNADNCTVDLTGDLSGFSHGQIVCSAAQMDTPDGYANHGAWVSHWARMNHGADASATGKDHKPGN